jgi:hypothetical protein
MSNEQHINLCVCIPSMGTWKSKFGQSVAMMFSEFMLWKPEGLRSKQLQLVNIESSMLVHNRHLCVVKALQQGATHILFLDADIQFPKNLPQRLIERDKDVVAGDYTIRGFPAVGVARNSDGEHINPLKKNGMQKVRFAGLGVMMIKADVLKKLRPPLFMMEWIPDHKGYCGEDVYFCQLLQEAGVDIWIDHEVSKDLRHIGDFQYSWKMAALSDKYVEIANSDEKLQRETNEKINMAQNLAGNR